MPSSREEEDEEAGEEDCIIIITISFQSPDEGKEGKEKARARGESTRARVHCERLTL